MEVSLTSTFTSIFTYQYRSTATHFFTCQNKPRKKNNLISFILEKNAFMIALSLSTIHFGFSSDN